MTENHFIQKIKELKQIKPDKDWAVLCKARILPKTPTWQEQCTTVFKNLPNLFLQTKPVLAILVLLILLGAGLIFYLDREPAEIDQWSLAEKEQARMVVLALEDLQTKINQATEELKKIQEPQKILEARNVVVPTIEAARDVIAEAKKLEPRIEKDTRKGSQILAVKTNVDELESALDEMIAIQARYLIQDLETRILTEAQQEILEKAKQNYAQGDYIEALINCLFINQLDR